METICSNRKAGGFSFIDLLIVVLTVVLGFVVILPMLAKTHRSPTPRISCVNNLKYVGLACRLWAGDNGGSNVMVMSTNVGGTMEFNGQVYRHFLAMSNELGVPKVLFCPSDTQRTNATIWASFGNQNISYFLGLEADETKPQMILAGDRNITGGVLTNGNLMLCKSNTVLSWTKAIHNQCGNIALADGSVQQMTDQVLRSQLQAEMKSITNEVIQFAIP